MCCKSLFDNDILINDRKGCFIAVADGINLMAGLSTVEV